MKAKPTGMTFLRLGRMARRLKLVADILLLLLCVASLLVIVYDLGFIHEVQNSKALDASYRKILFAIWFLVSFVFIIGSTDGSSGSSKVKRSGGGSPSRRFGGTMLYAFFSLVVATVFFEHQGILASEGFVYLLTNNFTVMITLSVVSVLEISKWVTSILGKKTSPSMLLASSFLFIIAIGSLLLMLPRCSVGSLSYIDALFLSTSAVCVTGLSPVDISQVLTMEGQVVLLLLIQIGGLGVMTITSFFGLFFSSGRKFSGQIVVGDLISSKLNDLLRTLVSIVVVTLSIEAIGAIMLYGSVMETGEFTVWQGVYFSVFHSISAFCNAGFSTLSGNLSDPVISSLNMVRWVVCFLVIFGGIGFPIFSNLLKMVGHKVRSIIGRFRGNRPQAQPRLWQLNSFIVVRMTIFLLLFGWVFFLLLEWNGVLADMSIGDKISQGFLMSVTPRTAGFNGVDMSMMAPASLVLTLMLMWVGGGPQSAAGGIKVTTVYLAYRSIFAGLRGSDITARYRKIPYGSVQRSFGLIVVSLSLIMFSLLFMSIFEPHQPMGSLLFEIVSAVSTVGLSLGITGELGVSSKIVLIILMYVGRVGLLSILLLFMRQSGVSISGKDYSYPSEDILIT